MPVDLLSTATSSRKQMRDSRQSTSAMQATATLIKESVISGEDFRLAMRRLAGGVGIISGVGPGGPLGVTATAVTSLTAEPPSILCCLNRSLQLVAAVKEAGRFGVNMLRADHHDLAKRFAGMHGGAWFREVRAGGLDDPAQRCSRAL